MIEMIIWWIYNLYIYWYIYDLCLFLIWGLYTIRFLYTLLRFGEICVQCPIFANDICFLTGNERLNKTDKVTRAFIRRLRSFTTCKQRFKCFWFNFEFWLCLICFMIWSWWIYMIFIWIVQSLDDCIYCWYMLVLTLEIVYDTISEKKNYADLVKFAYCVRILQTIYVFWLESGHWARLT